MEFNQQQIAFAEQVLRPEGSSLFSLSSALYLDNKQQVLQKHAEV